MLKWNTPEGLKDLTIQLVNQKSVSGTKHEIDMAQLVYDLLGELPYFKENKDHLFIESLKEDSLDRKFVVGMVKSKKKTNKVLLTVGHIDTVDIQDYNSLIDMATKPYELTEVIKELPLHKDALRDLKSGDWLFGRGIMDMKAGVAWQMSLLEQYSESEDLEGNLIFIAVPDEEQQSLGVLSAIPFVNELIEKHDLEPIAVLNTEPNFASYPGDNNKYVYLGTAGKLLPGFYFVGQECHVGESLSGLNVNLIASEFIRRLEVNMNLSDQVEEEVAVPPTCLKYRDLKELYSAQTPNTGVAYFNIQTLKMTPRDMLDKFKEIAQEAIYESIGRVNIQNDRFKNVSNLPANIDEMAPKVMLYEELFNEAKKSTGANFEENFNRMVSKLKEDTSLDERDLNTKIITEVYNMTNLRGPIIIMHFAPPYYPHVGLREDNPVDKKLMEIADELIELGNNEFGETILKRKYHQGLTDLSYFALQDAEEVIGYLIPNTPSWGQRYNFPVEDIKKLNLPVINFGPHGRDPHQYTERLQLDYSFNKGPQMLNFFVKRIFNI